MAAATRLGSHTPWPSSGGAADQSGNHILSNHSAGILDHAKVVSPRVHGYEKTVLWIRHLSNDTHTHTHIRRVPEIPIFDNGPPSEGEPHPKGSALGRTAAGATAVRELAWNVCPAEALFEKQLNLGGRSLMIS